MQKLTFAHFGSHGIRLTEYILRHRAGILTLVKTRRPQSNTPFLFRCRFFVDDMEEANLVVWITSLEQHRLKCQLTPASFESVLVPAAWQHFTETY